MYESNVDNKTLPQLAKADANDLKDTVAKAVDDPKGAAKKAQV